MSVRGDPASEDRLVPVLEPELSAKLRELREPARIERGRDLRPFRARAHHLGAAAPAERESERVHEDRLPGPGLSGERGQPGPELHIEPLDDREVADCEMDQHRAERRMQGGRG